MKTKLKIAFTTFIAAVLLTLTGCMKEPMACFEVPATGTVGQSVSFSSSCSMDAHHYEWNFGDGTMSTDANPTHTYANAGVYTVKLITMSKNSKKEDETSKTITIQ